MRFPFAIALLVSSAGALATTTPPMPPPTNLPLVRAEPSDFGTNVLCWSNACADVLESLSVDFQMNQQDQQAPITDEYRVDLGAFCSGLNSKKPSGCTLAAAPPAPGITANWQPNGCGPADPNLPTEIAMWWIENAQAQAGYTGDRNQPVAGVTFLNACDRHDACYGYSFDKPSCDDTFRDNMLNDCSTAQNSMTCFNMANAYYAMVSSIAGQAAFDRSVTDRTCSTWAREMTTNGCA